MVNKLSRKTKMEKKKLRLFLSDRQEEAWLNQMAADGWQLTKIKGLFYYFTKQKTKYIYRIDFLDPKASKTEQQDYINFIEETGAEKIAQNGQWIYFRRPSIQGDFQLYSDNDSKLSYLKRIYRQILLIMLFPLPLIKMLISDISNGANGLARCFSLGFFVLFELFLIVKLINLSIRIKQLT
jgi:predicted RNA binding protein YcfA (HicA-like mRNA interferase family)